MMGTEMEDRIPLKKGRILRVLALVAILALVVAAFMFALVPAVNRVSDEIIKLTYTIGAE